MDLVTQREFFRAVAMWLECRLFIEQNEADPLLRTIGDCDRRAEMRLILIQHQSPITSHQSRG
jgi:hypothetical protein